MSLSHDFSKKRVQGGFLAPQNYLGPTKFVFDEIFTTTLAFRIRVDHVNFIEITKIVFSPQPLNKPE